MFQRTYKYKHCPFLFCLYVKSTVTKNKHSLCTTLKVCHLAGKVFFYGETYLSIISLTWCLGISSSIDYYVKLTLNYCTGAAITGFYFESGRYKELEDKKLDLLYEKVKKQQRSYSIIIFILFLVLVCCYYF